MRSFVSGMTVLLLVAADGRASEPSHAANSSSGPTVVARGVLVEVHSTGYGGFAGGVRVASGDVTGIYTVPGFKISTGPRADLVPGTLEGLQKLKGMEIVIYKDWNANTPQAWFARGSAPTS